MLSILLVSTAFAMPQFPGLIETDLGMPCTPTCDLCHSTAGGSGVPTQAFGIAMKDRGLSVMDSTVTPALDAMGADMVDSNGDGTIDTEELAQGLNPNPGGTDYCPVGSGITGPSYGCLSTVPSPAAGFAGLAVGLLAMLRRRRRS